MESLRVAFMGTPDFSVTILKALLEAKYTLVAVYTQPPRPVGRGHKISNSPVHQFAESHHIPVFTPTSLKSQDVQEHWKSLNLDVAVVAAYGLILPKAIIEAPRRGCINVHASLLPRWRGAAPIPRAILEGDAKTGITIMKMDEGLDTGDMLLKKEITLNTSFTTPKLTEDLAHLGAEALLEALPSYVKGTLKPTPQPKDGATYAQKLRKEEGSIDWTLPAAVLERKVRALNPWPGTWFTIGNDRIKIIEAKAIPLQHNATPGTIIDEALTVACGEGALQLIKVQKVGKSPLFVAEFLRGYEIPSRHLSHAAS